MRLNISAVVSYESTPTGLTVFDDVGIVIGLGKQKLIQLSIKLIQFFLAAWFNCLQLEGSYQRDALRSVIYKLTLCTPPSENLLFTGSDGGYCPLYDISDIIPSKEDDSQTSKTLSKPKQKFLGHTGSVFGLKFNPALNQLVTACSDTKVRGTSTTPSFLPSPPPKIDADLQQVYDVETGKIVTTYVGHTNGVRSCTFSPDEANFIVTGSYDTTVKVTNHPLTPAIVFLLCLRLVFLYI